ncbi:MULTISPECIES: hypothetical protein [Paenarthrobacter]|jgi:hypothetical protein|uniref:hypothetical protein n=1 Tax=Paenarthrobacter TaxID=1742992 RepID=UPI002366EEAB|nr:hypothetical protein [Paenarthrobacter sp. AB444]MDD7835369.1 hypothetical protein [Paenarthrobacter sp. AB444]
MKRGAAGTVRSIAAAVPAALFVAAAGTALHRQSGVWYGVEIFWGVAAALLLLASVQLWLAAWSRSIFPTAVAGVVAYAAVGVLSSAGSGKQLVLGDTPGTVWIYGIGAVTLVMLVVASRLRSTGPAAAAVAAAPPSRR